MKKSQRVLLNSPAMKKKKVKLRNKKHEEAVKKFWQRSQRKKNN